MTVPQQGQCLDVVVVGGGPAGLTASTYLRRFHRSCRVLDAGHSRARWIPESNNCPGFPDGVAGEVLLQRMRRQAESFGTGFDAVRVECIERQDGRFVLSAGPRRWHARAVIMATGIDDRLPDQPWVEQAIAAHALRLCAVCDAYEAADTRIGVYGRLADIISHGRFLRGYSSQVVLLPCDSDHAASELQAAAEAGLEVRAGGGRLDFDGKHCRYATDAGVERFDSVYPYLGARSTTGIVDALAPQRSDTGELVVDRHQMTSVPGLYAIGDVVSGLNQIAVAVGQAALAATHLHGVLPFVPRSDAAD